MALADICVVVRTGKLVDDYMAFSDRNGLSRLTAIFAVEMGAWM